MLRHRQTVSIVICASLCLCGLAAAAAPASPRESPGTSSDAERDTVVVSLFHGCAILPADNIWNRDIHALPVHAKSAAWVRSIGARCSLTVSFCDTCKWGQRINLTGVSSPKLSIVFKNRQSDPGSYPFAATSEIQQGDPDRHCLMLDTTACVVYELYKADWNDGSPRAEFGAIFPLGKNTLRADGASSADEAGLPILPGVIRWDEVSSGAIRHALRFQAVREYVDGTPGSWLWPARHTSTGNLPHDGNLPPMGARVRLRADFDTTGHSPEARVILQALKTYGALLADRGTHRFALSGSPSAHWPRGLKAELNRLVIGPWLEVVDESPLMRSADSGESR